MSIGAVAAQAGRRPSSIRYLAVIETGQRAGLTLDECPLFDDPALLPRKVPGF